MPSLLTGVRPLSNQHTAARIAKPAASGAKRMLPK
jgi:hypothetical protein